MQYSVTWCCQHRIAPCFFNKCFCMQICLQACMQVSICFLPLAWLRTSSHGHCHVSCYDFNQSHQSVRQESHTDRNTNAAIINPSCATIFIMRRTCSSIPLNRTITQEADMTSLNLTIRGDKLRGSVNKPLFIRGISSRLKRLQYYRSHPCAYVVQFRNCQFHFGFTIVEKYFWSYFQQLPQEFSPLFLIKCQPETLKLTRNSAHSPFSLLLQF